MKDIKNLFISLAVSAFLLVSILGIIVWGNITVDKIKGGVRADKYYLNNIMYSPDRNDFLKGMVESYLSKHAFDELDAFADMYSFGYNITKKNGSPVTSHYPKGRYDINMEKNSDEMLSFWTDGWDSLYVKIFILYSEDVADPIGKLWIYMYSYPIVYVGGMILWPALFIASLIVLLTIATPIYKVWLFLVSLLGGEIAAIYYSQHSITYSFILLNLLEKICLGIIVTIYILYLKKLRNGVQGITDTDREKEALSIKKYPFSLKPFAEDINKAVDNVTCVIEDKIKSERLKTELISNVSHDIKTPLTSIINFSDLIYNEKTENSTITEYAEHLHNQSVRMKDMMDALIEAARASSGAVDIQLVPCKVSTVLEQCEIEYAEKLEKKKITLIIEHGTDESFFMADVKAMSRIMDNLLVNIVKYGMPGSRAYIEATNKDGRCIITIKNVSADPLNISGEELTERFVRGDVSRHSDGYGLGLSIVKSLMDLMNADLSIKAKSDVFEVSLSFATWEEDKPTEKQNDEKNE